MQAGGGKDGIRSVVVVVEGGSVEKYLCCNNDLLHLDNLSSCPPANVVISLHLLHVNNAITCSPPASITQQPLAAFSSTDEF